MQGVLLEAVRQAGPIPGRTSVTSTIASSSHAPSQPTTTSKCMNARRSLLNAASRQPALLHRRRMEQASHAARALPERVAWSSVSPAKQAKLATAPRPPLSLLSTKTGSLMSQPAGSLLGTLEKARSVFLTGPPGCGKTHIVSEVKDALLRANMSVAVGGRSSLAAALVGGVTAHS